MAYRVSHNDNRLVSVLTPVEVGEFVEQLLLEKKEEGVSITLVVDEETNPEIIATIERDGIAVT